jgi:thiol-disulfide isomerase/thioredoxin
VVTLGSQLAPVTMLHFWATWCAPCIDEVPAIQRLAEDYADNHQFSLVMVAVQDDPDAVKEFLGDRFKKTLFDPQWQVARRCGTEKVPETFLLVNGEVVQSFIGATNWDDSAARSPIDEALRQSGG